MDWGWKRVFARRRHRGQVLLLFVGLLPALMLLLSFIAVVGAKSYVWIKAKAAADAAALAAAQGVRLAGASPGRLDPGFARAAAADVVNSIASEDNVAVMLTGVAVGADDVQVCVHAQAPSPVLALAPSITADYCAHARVQFVGGSP